MRTWQPHMDKTTYGVLMVSWASAPATKRATAARTDFIDRGVSKTEEVRRKIPNGLELVSIYVSALIDYITKRDMIRLPCHPPAPAHTWWS